VEKAEQKKTKMSIWPQVQMKLMAEGLR
jgi:hypothetical protein